MFVFSLKINISKNNNLQTFQYITLITIGRNHIRVPEIDIYTLNQIVVKITRISSKNNYKQITVKNTVDK